MSFGDVLGHEGPLALLRGALKSDRLPHALLFHGPEAVGKATVARGLAMALLCETGDRESCGRCRSCVRVLRGTHPDFLRVTRLPRKETATGIEEQEIEEGGEEREPMGAAGDLRKDIVVGQIRETSEHASFAPLEGRRRVFVLDPADRMNASAQNALLKILEEPPGGAVFVLVTARPHLLLPTIRSRCMRIAFSPLPVPRLAEALASRGMPREEAQKRAAFAAGRPGAALLLDLPSVLERREATLAALESLAASPRGAAELPALAAAHAGADEAELLEGLEMMETVLRDAARAAIGRGAPPESDRDDRLEALGRRLGPERAYEIVRALERLRGELRFNVNRLLLAESLLAAVAGGPLP